LWLDRRSDDTSPGPAEAVVAQHGGKAGEIGRKLDLYLSSILAAPGRDDHHYGFPIA
jgi:hypothetical protein